MKKTLTLIALFCIAFANAQIVNIPDPAFKSFLLNASPIQPKASAQTPVDAVPQLTMSWQTPSINTWSVSEYHSVDTNGDGEIQVSEAQAIKWLSINELSGLSNLTGIEAFTNLIYLNITASGTNAFSIDLSQNTQLQGLYFYQGVLSSVVLPQSSSLKYLDCRDTMVASLDISGLPNLQYLYFTSYFFQQFPILLTPLNLSQNTELIFLNCAIGNNASLDLSQMTNLKYLDCSYNNNLSSLNVSQCTQLKKLICNTCSIVSLDVSQCTLLEYLLCFENSMTELDLSQNAFLSYLSCGSPELYFNHPRLDYLNIKNGSSIPMNDFQLLVHKHICADEEDIAIVQTLIEFQETATTVSSYCSFTPGGNYNTISGNALYDNENDGCDINDTPFEFLRVNLSDGTNSGSTFTNFEGNYKLYSNAGTFTLTPHLENPTYFNVSPATTQISLANTNNNTASQDFCITPNGVHNDVEVVLAQITPARPGFDAVYSLVYKNKGNQPLSGVVSVTFDDAKLDFVSASITPSSQLPSSLSWDYTNLLPFENRSITFTLNVNSPQETPAVNNGDVLTFTANITPLTGDEIAEDNTFTYNQTVVGSYDPNDIYCLEGAVVDPSMIGKYLHYNVRFENTGTAAAENVVVATTINAAEYDLNSLQVLNASHNVYTRINGNNVEFIFENCQLAGSPSGGHGNILFKMKSLNSLQTNDDVTSNANIFFDYNFPIETNNATTVFETLSNQDFTKDNSVKVYPNPAKENVTISAKTNLSSITIYDAQGRIVQFIKANELEKSINLSNLSNGIYILDIVSEKGRMVEKLVKE